MYKVLFFILSVGGFVFSNSSVDSIQSSKNSEYGKYNFSQDLDVEDNKIEAGRKRGKKNRGRKRGGGGLR